MLIRLGRSIGRIIPVQWQDKTPQEKELITKKLVITMVIIAIVKIAVLILWI
jgi:hypothetical protein